MEKSLATNDGEYQATEVIALSSPVIVSRQRFLSGIVIKRRNGIAQAIYMGDLIAIEHVKRQSTKKNYFPGRWSVAQVLGFQGTESIMVLHLRHVKEVAKNISNSKFVTEYVRVDNSLAVSRSVEAGIEVDRILPLSVRLLSNKVFRHGNYLNFICEDLIEEWSFQCHFTLPVTMDGSQPAIEKEPSYLQRPNADHLPESIVEAFKLLDIPNVDVEKLAKRLVAIYEFTDAARFQVSKSSQIENRPPSPVSATLPTKESRKRGKSEEEAVPEKSKKRAKKQPVPKTKKRPAATQQDDTQQPKTKTSFHVSLGPVCFRKRSKDSQLSFYDTITLENKWVVKVGSLVKATFSDRREAPAQVLSIYRDMDAGHVFLEVRWFYQVSELPSQTELPDDLGRNEIIEVDEDVSHVKPVNLIGPLRLTSHKKKRTNTTLLCRYLFSIKQFSFSASDNLSPVTHWSGQEYTRIGLDCPKAFPGKIPDLLQAYGGSEAGSGVGGSRRRWAKDELYREVNITPGTVIVQSSNGTEYFEYIEWRPMAERYAAESTAKRLCKARVGDTVCLMSEEDTLCEPFAGPWQLAQILAIYRLRGTSSLQLELRFCFRFSELPKSIQEWAPNIGANQFFESDIVKRNVMASLVLAPAHLHFKERLQRSFDNAGICAHCPFFFASESMHIQSLVSHEEESIQKNWFVERGVSNSELAREVHDLKDGLQFCMILPHTNSQIGSGFLSMLSENCLIDAEQRIPIPSREKSLQTLIVSCLVPPQWNKCLDTSYLLPGNNQTRWKCRIGDMVAVECEEGENHYNRRAPFTVTWNPAQVVAFRQKTSGENKQMLEVRLRPIKMKIRGSCRSVVSTKIAASKWEALSVLLAPLLVNSSSEPPEGIRRDYVWSWWYPFLPTVVVVYDDASSRTADDLAAVFQDGIRPSVESCDLDQVVSALAENNNFTSEGMQLPLLCAIDQVTNKSGSTVKQKLPLEKKSIIHTVGAPLHQDAKSCYYKAVSVEVPSANYTPILNTNSNVEGKEVVWTANVGDPVVLQCDSPKHRTTPYAYRSSREVLDHKFGPFLVPTAVGEVVTIRKESQDKILLEIRWFLRESETSSLNGDNHVCEEVCETDWYTDNIGAENLIAPIFLHSHEKDLECDLAVDGLPHLEFFCNRFWSVGRKCSVPVSGLNGRIARGQLKSKRVGGNAFLAKVLSGLRGDRISKADNNPTVRETTRQELWRTSFEDTIGKLSLTDAARETDGNLSAIVGREIERRKIATFVQDAISGFRDTGKRPSLFVAGPPGTGKTATIRAVIRDLQSNLARSESKQMRFIILNGMETRHPHDIYSMLWDELDTAGTGRVNSKKAASHLKKYFTTSDSHATPELIVVMLDEIDYIVTKSQEVLYDMFELPLLSMEKKLGRQLVMIGVSNMLNLPDKLHPRVQSRIGGARVFFKSYSVEETKAILLSKLRTASPSYEVFHDDAILYASKKTAAMSGDIRKAFHMCKQAAELVLEDTNKHNAKSSNPKVFIKDVLRVSRDSFNSAQSRMIALCSPLEALLIITLASLSKTTGREFGGFDVEELVVKMASVANAAGNKQYLPPPSLDETLVLLRNLGASNLINLDSPQNMSLSYRSVLAGSGGAWPLVSLPVDDVAVLVALKDSQHHLLAQKHLGRQ